MPNLDCYNVMVPQGDCGNPKMHSSISLGRDTPVVLLLMMLSAAAAAPTVGMEPPTTLARPRQWAVQFLGLNVTRAYARHLYHCTSLLPLPRLIPDSVPSFDTLVTLLLLVDISVVVKLEDF
jgi:hypothetical protein